EQFGRVLVTAHSDPVTGGGGQNLTDRSIGAAPGLFRRRASPAPGRARARGPPRPHVSRSRALRRSGAPSSRPRTGVQSGRGRARSSRPHPAAGGGAWRDAGEPEGARREEYGLEWIEVQSAVERAPRG